MSRVPTKKTRHAHTVHSIEKESSAAVTKIPRTEFRVRVAHLRWVIKSNFVQTVTIFWV